MVLLPAALFLGGLAVAFVRYWPSGSQGQQDRALVAVTAAHMALTRMDAETLTELTEKQIERMIRQHPDVGWRNQWQVTPKGNGRFVILAPPTTRFPFYPYNLLTDQPSYRADESGLIRRVPVHRKGALCPEHAPVIVRVSEKQVQESAAELRRQIAASS